MAKQIEIEAGQTWKQRNGDLVTVEKVNPDNGIFSVEIGARTWQNNGRFWSDEFNHSRDLIEKIS